MPLRHVLLPIAVTVALFTPRAFASEHVFDVTGVVRSPLQEGRVVITHEDIAGFMPAMTMGFTVANPAEAAPLVVGDRVQFHLKVSETASRAADFKLLGRAATTSSTAATPTASRRLHEGDRVPGFSLLNQDGLPLTASAFSGHLTVLTFIFTRCPVPEYCPAMARRFAQLQRAILADPSLATRTRLLSISIDPDFDRPKMLQDYGAAVGANPAVWQFATGDKAEINRLSAAFAVFTERNGVSLDHTLCTALVDGEGRVVGLWRGNKWDTAEIVSALQRAGHR